MNKATILLYIDSTLHNAQRHTHSMKHNELRQRFFKFFGYHDHKIVKSSSLVPDQSDGSLIFTNSGMNQFKPLILNSHNTERVATIQKCIRAGGKHNDLDDVGKDLHHQTFFEMMGNWSFNSAFTKQEACEYAWHFLCDELKIDKNRLYVSYFGGSNKFGLDDDEECREIWRKVGLPDDKILKFGSENFWEMGAHGPCGLSTEIHYDRVGNRNAADLVNKHDSVVELWNIVFMSKLRDHTGKINDLGKFHIDTGMGFERILSVIQNKNSNYDTDVFMPLIKAIEDMSQLKYRGSLISPIDQSFRIISDHIRAVVFAISDGVLPDSTDAGFIVRKIIRKMIINSSYSLNIPRYQVNNLVPAVVELMKEAYPELVTSQDNVMNIVYKEEEQFWSTVDKAEKIFKQIVENTRGNVISGKDAFMLLDTYGLPLAITSILAEHCGKSVDENGFNKCKIEARDASRKSSKFNLPTMDLHYDTHTDQYKYDYKLINGKHVFPNVNSRILGIYNDQGRTVDELEGKGYIILENCQFYAQQGGQSSDVGKLEINNRTVFQVDEVRKINNVSVLIGQTVGKIKKGQDVIQSIDVNMRQALMRSHSATHLLNYVLQKFNLSNGQRGSSVDADRLRFDYSSIDLISKDRLQVMHMVENKINEYIKSGLTANFRELDIEEIKNDVVLRSQLKENRVNGNVIRLVEFHKHGIEKIVECCAGTHVLESSLIGDFVIMSDKSSGKNLRRIIALTGPEAINARNYASDVITKISQSPDHDKLKLFKKIEWSRIPYLAGSEIRNLIPSKKIRKSK